MVGWVLTLTVSPMAWLLWRSVRAPFGSARLAAVRLIVTMIDRDAKSMLAALTPDVWKVLTAWFLEYRHNNLFHTAYTKIWVAAVMSSHPSLQVRGDRQQPCQHVARD